MEGKGNMEREAGTERRGVGGREKEGRMRGECGFAVGKERGRAWKEIGNK